MDIQVNYIICRLCLNPCGDFEVIEEAHHEVLSSLLSLDLAVTHEPVVCKDCAKKLKNCFQFKSNCLYREDDFAERNACFFCKQSMPLSSFVCLNSDELDIVLLKTMIEQYFPELNLRTVTKPIACTTCHESLKGNLEFLANCASVEERIKKYREAVGSNNKGQVELKDLCLAIETDKCNSFNNETCGDIKSEQIIVSDSIKIENIVDDDERIDKKVKVEGVDEDNKEYRQTEYKNPQESVDTVSECIESVVAQWRSYNQSNSSEKHVENCSNVHVDVKKGLVEDVSVKTAPKNDTGKRVYRKFWSNSPPPEDDSSSQMYFTKSVLRSKISRIKVGGEKKYQCQVCLFVARAKCSMNRHMLVHQHPSEITMYECDVCGLKTKHKFDLRQHVKRHDNEYVTMYKRVARDNGSEPVRGDHSEVLATETCDAIKEEVLECKLCAFKTIHASTLSRHVKLHWGT